MVGLERGIFASASAFIPSPKELKLLDWDSVLLSAKTVPVLSEEEPLPEATGEGEDEIP